MTEHKEDNSNLLPKSSHVFLYILGFLVLIIGIGIAIYDFYKIQQQNTHMMQDIAQLKRTQTQSQETTKTLMGNHEDMQATLASFKTQLQSSAVSNPTEDWLLQKARFYLELAQINTHWSQDLTASIALLEQADALLKQSNLPKLLEIRQAIANELTLLKNHPKVDLTGLLAQLDAAQVAVSNLKIQPPLNKNEMTQSGKASGWRARFQESLQSLKSLVIIRRDDEALTPWLSPLLKSVIQETILLNLQEAQWALLHDQVDVYQLALKQAIRHLNQAWVIQDKQVQGLMTQLKTLQQAQLTPEKPKIGTALPLLNALIEDKKQGAK